MRRLRFIGMILLVASIFALAVPAFAQESMPEGMGDDIQPAPASIGADIPLTYFGPAPSLVQKELIGPYQLLKSATIDVDNGTITLPLYRGQLETGEAVWFIITDTNDEANAAALGINFSAKLGYAEAGNAVRPARMETDGSITFERGSVDFSPGHLLTPGETPTTSPQQTSSPVRLVMSFTHHWPKLAASFTTHLLLPLTPKRIV